MPVISDISSGMSVIIDIIKLSIEKPHLLAIFILAILFFPLNALDYIFTFVVNLFVLLMNILLFVVIIPTNIILNILGTVVNFLINVIATPINWLLGVINLEWDPPEFTVGGITPPFIDWYDIDMFGTNDTLIGVILDGLGLNFPIFKVKPIYNTPGA